MLQQLVVYLAKLAGLKKADDPEVILMEVEHGLRYFSGLDPEVIYKLNVDSLCNLFLAKDPEDFSTLGTVTILLKEEGAAYLLVNDPKTARMRLEKSLALLARIDVAKLPDELRESVQIKGEIETLLARCK